MAEVVRLSAPDFNQAAATVAQHIDTAVVPPRAIVQPSMNATPVDVAATGAAGAIRTKINSLSTQLAPNGPAIRQAGATAAASLLSQDATNAARMPSVPGMPAPGSSTAAGPAAKSATSAASMAGGGAAQKVDFTPLSTFAPPPDVSLIWCQQYTLSWVCTQYFSDGRRHVYNSPTDRSGVVNPGY
jgi:hypothetical protein